MKTIVERRAERVKWTDARLTADLLKAAAGERSSLVELLLDLVEFDHRSLSQKGAYSSVFDYCTRKLGYSSSEAGRRIAVARKGEEFPLLLEMLDRGELHLSGAGMLAGLLTPKNHESVLSRAKGCTQSEIERLAAALAPKQAPRDSVRAIRAPAMTAQLAVPEISAAVPVPLPAIPAFTAAVPIPPAAPATAEGQPGNSCPDLFGDPVVEQSPAAAEEMYSITFSATRETRVLLARATELLRHRFPKSSIDDIVNFALKKLLARIDRDLRKPPRPGKPRPGDAPRSRYIAEAVKQESWRRDGGQCAFIADDGTRCTSRAWLEFDHATPYALGGSSVDLANIRLYCRPHNAWAARQTFGPWTGGKMKPQNTS